MKVLPQMKDLLCFCYSTDAIDKFDAYQTPAPQSFVIVICSWIYGTPCGHNTRLRITSRWSATCVPCKISNQLVQQFALFSTVKTMSFQLYQNVQLLTR